MGDIGNGLVSSGCMIMLAPILIVLAVLLVLVVIQIPYLGWILGAFAFMVILALAISIGDKSP